MKAILGMLAAVLLTPVSVAGQKAAADQVVVVAARHVWTGDRVIHDARVIVKNGSILAVEEGAGSGPAGAEVVRVEWALPGLVLADAAGLTGPSRESRTITPELRALDGYDPFLPRPLVAASGVTTIYLSPGRGRLLAGQGAVVRPGTAALQDWVLRAPASIHGSVGEDARKAGQIFEPPVAPSSDATPMPPVRRQFPRARGGAFLALRELLQRAGGKDAARPPDDRYATDLRPLRPLLERRIPLRLRADTAADIYGAIQLARRFKLRLVLEGATEAWRLPEELAAAGVGVILRSGTDPAGKLPPPRPFHSPGGRGDPRTAALLAKAGVPIALVPARDDAWEDLLWYAAQSRSPGFGVEDVLRAVTSGAARVLGVEDQAGSLRPGVSADVVGFDGDPLSAAARPTLVLSAGRIVHRAARKQDAPVAIFARTVHTAAGDPIQGGVVLVEGGKITAVGRDVTVPPEARRIRLQNAVVVPGFVDAGGQAGLRAYRTDDSGDLLRTSPLATVSLDQPPAGLFDARFPDVEAIARSGVTTVVLTPGGGRPVSGPFSVVKTGGEPKSSIVRKQAGILFDYSRSAWSGSVVAGLRRTLGGAKRYVDAWKKYEADLAAWNKKNPKQAARRKPKKLVAVRAPKARDPVSGSWDGTVEGQGLTVRLKAQLELEGSRVTGTVECRLLPEGSRDIEGEFVEGHLTFQLAVQEITAYVDVEVGRDEMVGSWEGGGEGGRILLRRVALPDGGQPANKEQGKDGKQVRDKPAKRDAKAAGAKQPKGRPKAPKKVAAMEPYKALFALETPAFVAAGSSERLTREILKVFREEFELKTVLVGARAAPRVLDAMQSLGVGLACTGSGVHRFEGKLLNPALSAVRRKLPVVMRSGSTGDARTLYASAAYVVRAGMDPRDALRMITRWPAMIMGLDDRVGSLKRGLDADLVILDGEPFVPGTRVVKVMVDGRFVGEEEQR